MRILSVVMHVFILEVNLYNYSMFYCIVIYCLKQQKLKLQVRRLRPSIPQYLNYNPKLQTSFQLALVATQALVRHMQ